MAKRRIQKKRAPRASAARGTASASRAKLPQKAWSFLIYMCGDTDALESAISDDFRELCEAGSTKDIHVAVLCDRRVGARRYVLPEGGTKGDPEFDWSFDNVRVNTGDPREALKFLRWGVEKAPADHVAVVFSGMGINPAYVYQILLPVDDVSDERSTSELLERELFSICHDQTNRSALGLYQLSGVLSRVFQSDPEGEGSTRTVDLIGFDTGLTAFVEVAYQLRGNAKVMVAPQRPLPDNGWPYKKIISEWQGQLSQSEDRSPEALGRLIVDAVCDEYPQPEADVRMMAANLDLTVQENTARVLDTLAMAVIQTLGDWHILHGIGECARLTPRIDPDLPGEEGASASDSLASLGHAFVPAADMVELMEQASQCLEREAQLTPTAFGQRDRIVRIKELFDDALRTWRPQKGSPSLLIHSRPKPDRGLSILVPPLRTVQQIDEETGPMFSLSENSNYLKLDFCSRVHWPALLGVFQLIKEKPHALWRLLNTMMTSASGAARDALLQRLIGGSSVIHGLAGQFKTMVSSTAVSLTLEPDDMSFGDEEGQRPAATPQLAKPGEVERPSLQSDGLWYRLRVESSEGGATVEEHRSRVFRSTIEAALLGLEEMLKSSEPIPVVDRLAALGKTLGEDLLQQLAERLEEERARLAEYTSAPHLRLQIPRELMRFPWELMYDRYGMLAERFALGRQVFMETQLTRPVPQRRPDAIRVLVIGDPKFSSQFAYRPQQLPGAQDEAKKVVDQLDLLDKQLGGMPKVEVTKVIGEELKAFDLRELLRSGEYDIVHYAGHAYFDQKSPEASAWVLSDGPLHAQEIRNTLSWTDSPPWLVYANACEAGMDGHKARDRYHGNVFGLATAFINNGVAAYIAPLWPVDDFVAAFLAEQFYHSLFLERASLGEALCAAKCAAKRELLDATEPEDGWALPANIALSWASVVLYGDPTPRLLQSLWAPGAETEQPAAEQLAAVRPRKATEVRVGTRGFAAARKIDKTGDLPMEYTVWYGTNRCPVVNHDGFQGYSNSRDTRLHRGICKVVVPKSHKFGSVGSATWKRWLTFTDDRLKVADIEILEELAFWASIKSALQQFSQDERDALIFIHGFNVTFEEAAIRAAQIGFDLNVPGITAFYSWPSKGSVLPLSYSSDEATISASEQYIVEFLTQFASRTGARRVNIIAHSMGNRGLLRAIQRIAAQAATQTSKPFGQIFLAAPDVDIDLFRDLARLYPQVSERTTLYISSKDRALATSGVVHDHPRAGFYPPVTIVDELDTIEVSNIDLTLLGHSYYASAESILYDMREVLLNNSAPHHRARTTKASTEVGKVYWKVRG